MVERTLSWLSKCRAFLIPYEKQRISGQILIAWLTLAITGQWQSSPDWFDRAGRALGAYMIAVFWFAPLVAAYLNTFS
jgi:hypothetical protein